MTLSSGLGLAVLRVTLGTIFLMHGYLGLEVIGPDGIGAYTTRMGYPPGLSPILAWYLILAHSIGGLLLIVGLFTRWAALSQLPIMASAFFLHHIRQGFFLTGVVEDASKGSAAFVICGIASLPVAISSNLKPARIVGCCFCSDSSLMRPIGPTLSSIQKSTCSP